MYVCMYVYLERIIYSSHVIGAHIFMETRNGLLKNKRQTLMSRDMYCGHEQVA